MPGTVVRTTVLEVDASVQDARISNILFNVRQLNTSDMKSTFCIMELEEKDAHGHPRSVMQCSQIVMLDFFARREGMPGLIRWPPVSINTMEKVCEPMMDRAEMPAV
ncbi:hypothetical protein DFP92_107126 [Yoonia sediminilitoris]|uniref:Uncharacterized protein n=1 Tax=Yoonia sediminilitoris TaxID=1286148 RepID=A0A2T6KEW2_9RHOB|nr:hypothetical protein C8N45_107126 [Yoonia sediminilitoris]RCW94836.1 hypothetical protein DFP92_107126 [Yoonia sediminilitoris]